MPPPRQKKVAVNSNCYLHTNFIENMKYKLINYRIYKVVITLIKDAQNLYEEKF